MKFPEDEIFISRLLFDAVRLGKYKLVRILIEGGVNVNSTTKSGRTPLMVACTTIAEQYSENSVEIEKVIHWLLQHGSDPNLQDCKGRTCLMYACSGECPTDVIRILLESGADSHIRDKKGRSVMDFALLYDRFDVIKCLHDFDAYKKVIPNCSIFTIGCHGYMFSDDRKYSVLSMPLDEPRPTRSVKCLTMVQTNNT